MKILGLDMGTSSIGWALIDDEIKTIIDCGVRIFPEGVNRDNLGKEVPKNMQRRQKRQTRRQLFRRKYRKHRLAQLLAGLGMFPPVNQISRAISSNGDDSLRRFFSINPYECRSRAFNGEKLTLLELGRVLYHFAQRRGYKESLKDDAADTGTLYDGDIKEGKAGINETWQLIQQYGTLGNALYNTNPAEQRWRNRYTTRKMYTDEFEVIWQNQQAFYPAILTPPLKQEIGDAAGGLLFFQRPLKPQKHLVANCTLEPGKKRGSDSSIAFELRRMYEFINSIRLDGEPLAAKQRDVLVEMFLSKEKFQFGDIAKKLKTSVTRFNYEEEKIVAGTKSISALRKIFTPAVWDAFTLQQQEEILNIKRWAEDKTKTINYLKTKFGLSDKQADQFIRFRPSKGYSSLSTKATLNLLPFLQQGYLYNEAVWLGGVKNVFGDWWDGIDEEIKNMIVTRAMEIYYDDETDSIAGIKHLLTTHFNIHESRLKKLYHHSVDMAKGDGSMQQLPAPEDSRNPVVQQALYELRKLVNAIIVAYGKPGEIRVELSRELKSSIAERDKLRLDQYKNEVENNEIKAMLDEHNRPHTGMNIQKLKLFKEIQKKAGNVICPYTGDSIGLHQLWNNEVDVEHIVPYSKYLDDSLNNKTLCYAKFNRIHKHNLTPFEAFKPLGEKDWEDAKARALALLPYPKYLRFADEKQKSLEDFENKKLNDTRYMSRLAKAYLEKVCKNVRVTQGQLTALLRRYWGLDGILNPPVKVPFTDGEYFIAVDEQNNFIEGVQWQNSNKANDANIDKLAKKGIVLHGTVKNNSFHPYKARTDHKHHVVDALAIAFTKTGYLQAVSTMKGKGLLYEDAITREANFPEPMPNFFHAAKQKIEQVLVSHKRKNRIITRVSKTIKQNDRKIKITGYAVRGTLHGETVMGRRSNVYGNQAFHARKKLSQVNKRAQVDKIVDPAVKKIVEKAIITAWQTNNPALFESYVQQGLVTRHGNEWVINAASKIKYDVPDGAFFEVKKDEAKKITAILPKVFMPAGNIEKGVPVIKVRLKENSAGAVQLKDGLNQWVEPGNNYGLLIYINTAGEYCEKVVTFWEAAERKKQGLQAFALPPDAQKLVATLQINDLFLIGLPGDEINFNNPQLIGRHLYRVQKLSASYYVFRRANAATLDFEAEQLSIRSFKAWQQQNPVKVKIDVLGKIKKA